MSVDSFKFLPRIIAAVYQMDECRPELPIPWTPLARPLSECTFGLVSSGGFYQRGVQPPFDLQRERAEPTWGDPGYRVIPRDITPAEIGVSHLHLSPRDLLEDCNILLPIDRFDELVAAGRIGGLAHRAYSFMGYQGYPPDTTAWQETYGPQVAEAFKAVGVQCVLLTPA